MLSDLAPARRRLVVGVLGLLALLILGVVALGVSAALCGRAGGGTVDQASSGPVVLVPGYGGSVASLQPLAATLRAQGRDVTIVSLPDQGEGDLGAQADVLGRTVSDVRGRTGSGSVDLVGYSAGGVVARLWVAEGGGAGQVRRLVMLGSPLHGTDIAALGTLVSGTCPTACQQLAPDSAVLDRLDTEPVPGAVQAVSIWSTADDVVRPPSSSVEDGVPSPSLQSVCAGNSTTHTRLPTDPQVQRMVTEALGGNPIPAWTAADCARLSS